MVNDYNDGHQGYESMAEILCSGGWRMEKLSTFINN